MTEADTIMNPQYFGKDPVDSWIKIWINPKIRTRIAAHFWFKLDALAEVYVLWLSLLLIMLPLRSVISCLYYLN